MAVQKLNPGIILKNRESFITDEGPEHVSKGVGGIIKTDFSSRLRFLRTDWIKGLTYPWKVFNPRPFNYRDAILSR